MKSFFPYRLHLLLVTLVCFLSSLTAFAQSVEVYDSLPQLEARIRQAGDATLVINFWATWCKPCVEELPCFEELREKYEGENVQVLLVSLDFKSLFEKKLLPFLRTQQFQSEVVLFADQDANSWIPQISEDWDGAIPATLVMKGKKRNFNLGQFQGFADLEAFVLPFLADASIQHNTAGRIANCVSGK
jgi:thiol-disulfide isomerase/thioredoxin